MSKRKRCASYKFEQFETQYFDDLLYLKYEYEIDIFRNSIANNSEIKSVPI